MKRFYYIVYLLLVVLLLLSSCSKKERIAVIDVDLLKRSDYYKKLQKEKQDYKDKIEKKIKELKEDKALSLDDRKKLLMVFNQDLQEYYQKLDGKFFSKIKSISSFIAEKKDFYLILSKEVYPVSDYDITEEILNYLDKDFSKNIDYKSPSNMQIAYIDLNRIFNSNYFALYQKNLQTYFDTLNKELNEKMKKKLSFAEKEKLLDEYNKKFSIYRKEMKDKFLSHLKKVVKDYSKYMNFKIVLYKEDVFFGGQDITDDVLKELEK